MTLLHRLASVVRWALRRDRAERDLHDELQGFVDMAAADRMRDGAAPAEARRLAMLDLGGVEQAKERVRSGRYGAGLDAIVRDVRYAVRMAARNPGFTCVVVVTLALGIGANTAIFSILNSLVLRSLPVHEPARLVHVTDSILREGTPRVRAWAYPAWLQIRARPQLFEAATAWSFTRFDLASGGETQFVEGIWADGGFFETLGVPASVGRTFSSRDDQRGGGPDGPVTVISHSCWQRRFGGAADVIGRPVRLNGVPFTIIGVTPPGFFGVEVGRAFDFIVPLQTEPLMRGRDSALDSASTNFLSILARLRPGESLESAGADLRRAQAAIREATLGPWSEAVRDRYLTAPFTLVPAATGYSNLRSRYDRPLRILAVIVGLVLLIGCVNVANLLLARAIGRRHELSVRRALGASRWRLARQLFAESLVLSAAGGAVGVLIAISCSRFLVRQLSTPAHPVSLDVPVDGRVLAFTIVLTAVTCVLFGTAPALRAARAAPVNALKQQGRSIIGDRHGGAMASLVTMQVALTAVLLVASGLFVRSFISLANRPLGFEPEPVLVVRIATQGSNVGPAERAPLYERIRQAVAALPNVSEASISELTPAGGGGFTPPLEIVVPLRPPWLVPADQDVFGNLISPGWLRTFGTHLTAGRDFSAADSRGAPRVVMVNQTFARRFFGGATALGSTMTVYPRTPRALSAQIVGIVEDAVYGSPHERIPATWYLPIAQFGVPHYPFDSVRLSVRAETGSPARLTKSVASAVAAVDPHLALTFRLLADQVEASLTRDRLMAQLAGCLGLLALLLAGLGLYGVSAYAMGRRRTEIAIRIALGAAPTRVVVVVLLRVLGLIAVGIGVGTGLSIWAAQFVRGLIYELPARDPATLVGAAAVLSAIGAMAAWLPAWRAAHTDPVAVLRES